MITIYSVPHTGTRFVQSFYNHCGVRVGRRHVGHKLIGRGQTDVPDGLRIIPVRSPYDCYMSWLHLHPERMAEFIPLWERLIEESKKPAFFFPLDIAPFYRKDMLKKAIEYVDGDVARVDSFEWKPVNESGRDDRDCPESMKFQLRFAHDWYVEHTKWS